MAPEKVRTTAQDVEVCPPRTTLQIVEFSRGKSKRQRWRTGLLFASAIAVTAAISAALGIAAGLGIAGGSSPSCSDPADTSSDGGEATNVVNPEVDVHQQSSVLGCPIHPFPSPLPSPLPDKIESAIAAVERRLAGLIDDETMPGLVASITYRDTDLWSSGFGATKKDVPQATPDKDTLYRIASVSKIFVVLMVYHMYNRGLVRSLDDPLNDFCPSFHINNRFTSSSEDITLRQVMTSMSGLPREAPCGQPEDPAVNLCPHDTTTILERLSQQYTVLPPWTQPSYSNLGFGLLGRCLVSHFFPETSYEDYLQENILRPLGMSGTGFNYSHTSVGDRLATGYESDGSEEPLYDIGWWGPASQMYSSASDLNKLAKFLYSNGAADDDPAFSGVLSPSLRRLILLPTYTNRDLDTGVGAPWEVSYQQDYTLIMKGGNLRGYSAVFSVVPDLKLGLNVLFSGMWPAISWHWFANSTPSSFPHL
ncbi:Putative beta-lactamase-like 1 [Geodia barretti]|uniref:Beta-lactamase-like 1 n=1 Tax=Geodia barretti TaxID=519541 RepID=A0AA35RUM8_GEOBA|nr:Putative beta-lactamase-like 1 [Geodia barretti]